MPQDQVPTDWAADVKRYVPDADDSVIAKIVSYCGIALRSRDASLVSFTDQAETARVRENYLKKKLALTEPDSDLDGAIAAVGERMSDTTYRNRVTVYYLLADHFGKLGLFGGAAPVAAAAAAPVVPIAAAASLAAAAAPAAAHAIARPQHGKPDDGFIGFAALVGGGAAAIMLIAAIAGSYVAGRFDVESPPPPAAPAPAAVAAPAIPEGAGIVSEVIDGRPKVSVYFAVGEAAIAPEFAAAVAPVREWLAANPDDRVQLSGFTDPTGDAAANAELAKNRAQAVSAELAKEGVDAARIDLVKPEDTSDETTDLAGARRVEITVTGG